MNMNILIFNCGSSSQGFKVYRLSGGEKEVVIARGKAKNVATKTKADAVIEWTVNGTTGSRSADLSSHRLAAQQIIAILLENNVHIDAIGHRFVHGGMQFDRTTRIDSAAMQQLEKCLPFAPIHNPNSYNVIEVCREMLTGVSQFAVFDTAFHAGMPEHAWRYAIPKDLADQHGFRKYGFHGLSYQFVSARMAELMEKPLGSLKLILCHLGTGGSSVSAMRDGKSLDTSMGYSPLPGLVMSTRSGDIDPEVILEMIRQGSSPDEVSRILNNRSGLVGLSGISSNLQEIIEEAEKGNLDCQLAYEVYAHRLKKYLGAYTWLLKGADAIVFTDDVGQRCWQLRQKVCSGVESLGIILDADRNKASVPDKATRVSADGSRTQVWVVPTDEELVILREVETCLQQEEF